MIKLLIYYNHNHNNFIIKIVSLFSNTDLYKVGYINQYNHELVQVLYLENNKLINCLTWDDYIKSVDQLKEESTKNKLIDKAICLLYKMKK